ncbi:helix-turn-helix transcriptional regulator [Chryseobacterium sp.]|uniref:helix-turn-helix transcriptional regulator n=1 Tax=Chryseobacterium sp. TaxID=1871047 RepID=UPI00260B3685|nr:response regulator transcription factor [Chryseobacterium sp.]
MNTAKTIDWSSPDILEQLILNIKNPLENIITVSKSTALHHKDKKDEIIFSSSKEISDIIEEIMLKTKAKTLNLTFRSRPEIFDIYESNENVRDLCSDEINPQKMAKIDQDWLINLEKEVFGSLTQNELNLYELSYKMAVSERQLHRKVANLVYLTPNKYIRVLRLHKAKQMIDNYIQKSISQIAYAVGYNDVHYFSRLFADQYDITPKELISSLE